MARSIKSFVMNEEAKESLQADPAGFQQEARNRTRSHAIGSAQQSSPSTGPLQKKREWQRGTRDTAGRISCFQPSPRFKLLPTWSHFSSPVVGRNSNLCDR